MTHSPRYARLAAFALGSLWPAVVIACPVCGGGGDSPRSQLAFFNTTILLSLLPLGMIGGGVLWLRRDGRDFLAEEFEDRDALTPIEPGPRTDPPDLHLVPPGDGEGSPE